MTVKQKLVISAIVLLPLFMLSYIRKLRNDRLSDNGIITSGTLLSHKYRIRARFEDIEYSFTYKGKQIKAKSTIHGIKGWPLNEHFLYKKFPVIFLPSNPKLNEILITPDRFKRFNVPFPDSLNWVKQYWTKDYIEFD